MPSRRVRRRCSGACCAIVMLVTAGPVRAQSNDDLRSYYTANGLLQRGLHELAIPEYRAFLENHPDSPKARSARYGLAVALFRLDRLGEAAQELDRLVDDEGFEFAPEVLLLRGHCHMAAGENAQAADRFERLVNRFPDHASAGDASALLAEARYRAGQYDRVDEAVRYLIEHFPQSPRRDRGELMGGLGAIARGDYAAASERLGALLERSPKGQYADQAMLLLAQSMHRLGRLDEADSWYRRAAERKGSAFAPQARLGLAHLAYGRGQGERASAGLDELIASGTLGQRQDEARLLRGRIALDAGELDHASTLFSQMGKDTTLRDDARYWLAKVALRSDKPEDAAHRLGELIEQMPGSDLIAEAMFDRGVALQRAGQREEALDAFGRFLDRFPEHALAPGALRSSAVLAHEMGQYAKSLELCGRFTQRYPDDPQIQEIAFLAGENEYLGGHYEAALARFRAILDGGASGDSAQRAAYRVGMSLVRLDRFDEAREFLASVSDGAQTPGAFLPALFALGDGYFAQGDWQDAEGAFDAYIASADADASVVDDALLKIGIARLRRDDPRGALEMFEELRTSFPDSEHALQAEFESGQALVLLDRPDEASEAFTRVLTEDKDARFTSHALRHLGAIAMARGDFDAAAGYYARLSEQDNAPEALLYEGQALLAAGEYEGAIEALDDAIERGAGPDARAHRAIALSRLGRTQEAVAQIEDLLEDDSLPADLARSLRYERAYSLRELGRNEAASEAYTQVLQSEAHDPLRAHALVELAGLEMDAGRFAKSVPLLEESLEMLDDSGDALRAQAAYRLGVSLFRTGKFDRAQEVLGSVLEASPGDEVSASALLISGDSLFRLGRFEKAIARLQQVIARYPDDASAPPALLRLGEAQAALQRWSASEKTFASFVRLFPEHEMLFQARFGSAWAQENQGRFDEAIAGYRKVIATHQGPTAARAQFQIGECLFAQGKHQEAATEFLRVDILYDVPKWTAAALYEGGRCFEQLRKVGQAREQFAQVIARFADSDWARLAQERLDALSASSAPGG